MTNIVRIWKSIYREVQEHVGKNGENINEFINLAVLYVLVHYIAGKINMRQLRKCYGLLKAGLNVREIAIELGLMREDAERQITKREERIEKRVEERREVQRPVEVAPVVIEQVGEEVDHVLLRDNPWVAIIRSKYVQQSTG